jgi:NAD-dependent DNA ligase
MIRGIGPVYARKLPRAFGDKVFDIIEAQLDRLREVDGIGPVRAGRITAAWAEQKAVREIMVFLHSHGVGTARVTKTAMGQTRPSETPLGGSSKQPCDGSPGVGCLAPCPIASAAA